MSALQNRRVVITRAGAQAAEAGRALAALGGVPIYFPTVRIAPAADPAPLSEALQVAQTYDWIVFTSANAVRAVGGRLAQRGLTMAALRGPKLAAIGPATARTLTGWGLTATLLPEEQSAGALAEALLGEVRGLRVLVPQSDRARPHLAEALRTAGAQVTVVTAYRTLTAVLDPAALAELARGVDAVTFASPSAVEGWVVLTGGQDSGPAVIACLGPTTAEAARMAGLPVQVVATEPHTWPALLTALEVFWNTPKD